MLSVFDFRLGFSIHCRIVTPFSFLASYTIDFNRRYPDEDMLLKLPGVENAGLKSAAATRRRRGGKEEEAAKPFRKIAAISQKEVTKCF